jgi:hypothetical protein
MIFRLHLGMKKFGRRVTKQTKQIGAPNRKTLRQLECINYLDAVALWRTKSADQFDGADIAAMAQCFNVFALHGGARWFEAVQGNAAAACGIALRMGETHQGLLKLIEILRFGYRASAADCRFQSKGTSAP